MSYKHFTGAHRRLLQNPQVILSTSENPRQESICTTSYIPMQMQNQSLLTWKTEVLGSKQGITEIKSNLNHNLDLPEDTNSTYLAEHGFILQGESLDQFFWVSTVLLKFLYTKALRVNEICGELVHVHPLCKESALLHLLPQKFQSGLGSGVLLHVFHKAVALGMASNFIIDQETPLNIAIGTHKFFKLFQCKWSG